MKPSPAQIGLYVLTLYGHWPLEQSGRESTLLMHIIESAPDGCPIIAHVASSQEPRMIAEITGKVNGTKVESAGCGGVERGRACANRRLRINP